MIAEYKLNLSLKDIPEFVNKLLKNLGSLKADRDKFFDVKLALQEALVNAVKYGNRKDKNKKIILKIEGSAQILHLEIKDAGVGFDYKKIPSPTEEENIKKTSGRGVFLIRKFMDKVEFSEGGSKIKMTKFLK